MKCFEFLGRSLMVASSGDPNDAVELEPIVAATTVADMDEESGSVVGRWITSGQCRQKRYGRSSRHRPRSRSSPVRSRAVEDKVRVRARERSPSATSPRRQAKDRFREHVIQSLGTYGPPENDLESASPSEDYVQASNSYWCGSSSKCGTAYFSLRPPAAPLRLVPIVTPSQPPMAPSMHSEVTRIARVSFAKTSNWNPTACASSVAQNTPSENVDPVLPSSSCVKLRHSSMSTYSRGDQDLVQRSIATQAKSLQDQGISNGHGFEATPPDEWLGGVRALRDFHVRLVLRQLRHINRLNRALDRAVRPPPPPPPTSPRAPTRKCSFVSVK